MREVVRGRYAIGHCSVSFPGTKCYEREEAVRRFLFFAGRSAAGQCVSKLVYCLYTIGYCSIRHFVLNHTDHSFIIWNHDSNPASLLY